ncbi:helix-turn-helix domain-containing protein [Rosenbergiella nectarea]|uniref:helix-turn-helix domain-containing protein n=1 Tax=Rosenbergiella nectarea TaxID=988801 RepID=UPI001F4E5BE6|nr:helix-turn-helix domain-containing protein [Rosenbergiella nectarea]
MKSKDLAKFLAESYGLQFLKPSTVTLSDESEFCTIQTPSAVFSRFAWQCGFSSQSHFSQAFRRYFGMTPKETRAQRPH